MQNLSDYIVQYSNIDEGLISKLVSIKELKNINSEELRLGILDMYDYIVDEDNIELFYQDMPKNQQAIWKSLYELYQKKVWSIIDIDCDTQELKELEDFEDDEMYLQKGENETDVQYNLRVQAANKKRQKDFNSRNKVVQWVMQSFPVMETMIDVTPEFRRNLRHFIHESRNSKLDIKPSDPESMMALVDDVKEKIYMITINRTTGLINRMFRATDKKYLKEVFSNLTKNNI